MTDPDLLVEDVDEDLPEISTKGVEEDDGSRKPVRIKVDGRVVTAVRPKDSMMAYALGIMTNKYAPDSELARVAFDFLRVSLEPGDWAWMLGRIQDRDDEFDTEALGLVFEGLFEQLRKQATSDRVDAAPNRAAKRAAGRRG